MMLEHSERLLSRLGRFVNIVALLLVPMFFAAYDTHSQPPEDRDPHVVKHGQDREEDREFISPPTLQYPIYACATSVVVKDFLPGAKLEVFVDGDPTPIGSTVSWLSSGQNIDVSIAFIAGQVVTARQTFDRQSSRRPHHGATSSLSNAVPVTSHREDYPSGLPQPRLGPTPLYQCGRAVGIGDVLPGAWVRVFAENPANGGGFDPPVQVGSVSDFAYTVVSPAFIRGARIWAESGICTDISPRSDTVIVQPEPATIPKPSLAPVHEGTNMVTVWGPGGNGDPPVNGATLDIFADNRPPGSERVGGQPTPGGGQQVFIDPAAAPGAHYTAMQALCTKSDPSDPAEVVPCRDLPPARIKPPLPGDTQVEVTEYVPGARILVFADGDEIGDSGPPVVNLSRPLMEGETVTVRQHIGDCDNHFAYVIDVECALGGDANACSGDWPAFRHSGLRNARQTQASALSRSLSGEEAAGEVAISAGRRSPARIFSHFSHRL